MNVEGFRSLERIGQGASASVYRAEERSTGRHVALKIVDRGERYEADFESLSSETKVLAEIGAHPNIVNLYSVAEDNRHRPVLVIELCAGSFADHLARNGPLEPHEAVSVGVKMAAALATAHHLGVLHSDVKPSNFLISSYGEPKLSDFGVAVFGLATSKTSLVAYSFTTHHASPEQLEGRPVSPATDIYSLGSSLYELLNGTPPFEREPGESIQSVILRILEEPARPLNMATVPVALADLIKRAMAKDPMQRPQSAYEFAQELSLVALDNGWAPTDAPFPSRSRQSGSNAEPRARESFNPAPSQRIESRKPNPRTNSSPAADRERIPAATNSDSVDNPTSHSPHPREIDASERLDHLGVNVDDIESLNVTVVRSNPNQKTKGSEPVPRESQTKRPKFPGIRKGKSPKE
ncbi:MAG: serine/threonine-protein kinase [Ferrimicrobium sp.]